MIEIKNLTMKYKNGKGVSDISISVDNGEAVSYTHLTLPTSG